MCVCVCIAQGAHCTSDTMGKMPGNAARTHMACMYSGSSLGTMLGWISAMLYLSSRTPQIVKNFRARVC